MAAAALWWTRRGPDVVAARDGATPACAKAAAAFPPRLGSLPRGDLDVAGAARYGDPAVIVRCGVSAPGPTPDECVAVDDVDWVVHPLADGTRMTTYGRSPAVEVLVPAAHAPAPLLLPALAAAARALPSTGHRCSG